MVSPDELEAIETEASTLADDSVDFLSSMISTNSINPPGDYDDIHSVVSSNFEAQNWDVETVRTPESLLDELGVDPDFPRPNILAYVSSGTGPTLVMNAHLDTVPVDAADWTHEPFGAEIDDGRIWGRGARDSKGRIAAYSTAARILENTGLVPEAANIVLAITVDEEIGGESGPGYLIRSGKLQPDYAIVEGSYQAVEYAAAGVIHFSVTIKGKASHAGVDPEGGVNALIGAARVINELDRYAGTLTDRVSDVPRIGSPTCTPATIDGGQKTNVVPASCTFTVDRRVIPEENVDDAAREFRERVNAVDLPPGATVEVEELLRAQPFVSDPDGSLVQSVVRNARAVTGQEVPLGGTRGFTDARFFAEGGAETVKYGPGDDESNVHGADENIKLDQLTNSSAIIAAAIVDVYRE